MKAPLATRLLIGSAHLALIVIAMTPAAVLAQSGGAGAPPATTQGGQDSVVPAAPLPEPADSAESSTGIEDIIVTAQRREERLQDVPIAISAATGESLAKQGVTDVTQLGVAIPGLKITNNNGQILPRLRGVASTATGPGVENAVALYVDGVYYGATTASILSLNNIERIEVLKGPQGTLFGRNATGGLVHVITRNPKHVAGMEFNLSYGNYETVTANSYLTGGLTDTVAADVALVYTHQGKGFGRNLFTGKPTYRTDHDFAGRVKMLFEPSDGTTFTLSGDYADTDNSNNTASLLTGTAAFPGGALASYPKRRDTNVSRDAYTRGWQYGGSLRLDQSLGDLQLMSLTAYRKSRYDRGFDFDVTTNPLPNPVPQLPYRSFDLPQKDRQFSQEVQLLSPTGGAFTWVLGAYYYKAESGFNPLQLTFESRFGPFQPGGAAFIDSTIKTKSLAGFAQGTLALGARTNVTGGIRYTDETKSVRGTAFNRFTPTALPVPGAPFVVRPDIVSRKFSYRASLDHHFNDDVMVYASFNRGFKSGGFAATAPGDPGYEPEELDAYEVGIKADLLDGRVRLNAAVFHYDYTNLQIQTVAATGTRTTNGAAAKIDGADLDFEVRLSNAFRVRGGLQLVDDRFESYPNALFGTPRGGLGQTIGSATGNRLPLAFRTQINVAPEYTFELADGGSINLNGSYSYNSGYFLEADNIFKQAAFDNFNASVRWTLPDGKISLMAWGRNLSNEAVLGSKPTLPGGRNYATYTPPRTYGVTLGAKF